MLPPTWIVFFVSLSFCNEESFWLAWLQWKFLLQLYSHRCPPRAFFPGECYRNPCVIPPFKSKSFSIELKKFVNTVINNHNLWIAFRRISIFWIIIGNLRWETQTRYSFLIAFHPSWDQRHLPVAWSKRVQFNLFICKDHMYFIWIQREIFCHLHISMEYKRIKSKRSFILANLMKKGERKRNRAKRK